MGLSLGWVCRGDGLSLGWVCRGVCLSWGGFVWGGFSRGGFVGVPKQGHIVYRSKADLEHYTTGIECKNMDKIKREL